MRTEGVLSQAQLGIYLECINNPEENTINFLLHLDQSIDIQRLVKTAEDFMNSHRYFSLKITERNGIPYQYMPEENEKFHIEFHETDEENFRNVILPELKKEYIDMSGERLIKIYAYQTEKGKYLFFEFHHIAFDGVGVRIFGEKLSKAYAGEDVPEEEYNAIDFAEDEAEARKGEKYSEDVKWYEETFGGLALNSTPFPDKHEKPARKIYLHNLNVTPSEFHEFCKSIRVGEAGVSTGIFALISGAYTHQNEALLKTGYNCRNAKTSRAFGTFLKLLPVYCRWDNETKTKDFFASLKKQLNGCRVHNLFSNLDLKKICDISNAPLFVYHGIIDDTDTMCGKPSKTENFSRSIYDLSAELKILPDGKTFELRIDYDAGKYSDGFVKTFSETYDFLMREVMTKEFIRDIEYLSPSDSAKMKDFHNTSWPVRERPAYRLLQDSAEKYPERIAAIANGEKITYRELNSCANKLGRVLRDKGLGIEGICALILKRGIDVYITRQGILKSGGAFLPIVPDYPDERIKFIISDSGAEHLVTSRDIYEERREFLESLHVNIILIEDVKNDSGIPDENLNLEVPYDAIAYCIYTSGTTGQPKGVMISQKNLVNFVDDNPRNHEILGYTEKGNVSLALASISFDVSIMEEFIPLANGLTICMANEDEIFDAFALKKLCLDNNVDIVSCTPSYMANLLSMPEMTEVIQNIKSIDFGAEALTSPLCEKLHAINPELYIMNGYGPTEATISCTMKVITDPSKITIGIPNANVEVLIIDGNNKILPSGALGELAILGSGVGTGYRNREDLTAKSFITLSDSRAYKSGDLALILENGEIEYHGRIDNQVKLHGLRIELGEIESVINQYPGIDGSVVIVRHEGGDYLAGYFTASEKININALKAHLSEKLTNYMIPNVLMQLDELPLTANRKIDKNKLPVPERNPEDLIKPQNEIQQKIFDCAAKITGSENFGINTNLFEAGLTSLGMISLNVMLHNLFADKDIRVDDIRSHPTVEELADFITGTAGTYHKWEIQNDYPLTKSQEGRVYVLRNITGEDSLEYNIPFMFRLGKNVDAGKLKTAIENAINAHSYMKAFFFENEDGHVRIKRNDDVPASVNIYDVEEVPDVRSLIRPYKLFNSNLYRAEIYRTKNAKYLFMDVNHMICDGESIEILLRDIDSSYSGEVLTPEKYTGFEEALDEEFLRGTDAFSKAEKYFDDIMKGLETFRSIPPKNNNVQADENNSGNLFCKFSSELSGKIKTFCEKNSLTLNAFFCSVFGYELCRLNGTGNILFNTVWNGRSDPRLSDSVFFGAKNIPVRFDLDFNEGHSLKEYVSSMSGQLTGSMSNYAYSYLELFLKYNLSESAMLIYQGQSHELDGSIMFCGEEAEFIDTVSLNGSTSEFALKIFMLDDGNFELQSDYSSELYSVEAIRGFQEDFMRACDKFSE